MSRSGLNRELTALQGELLIDIPRMGEICRDMLRRSLKSYIEEDTALAWTLIEDEKIIDALYNQVFRELIAYMMETPGPSTRLSACFWPQVTWSGLPTT
ncbi:MAG: PhoU domain-containing protein [Syntrophomonadaceae bacterium]|nr:PhoU domain-containing protein [Syntrophomonadaceae bacterium]